MQHILALAVITHATRLEHRRPANPIKRIQQPGPARNRRERGNANIQRFEHALFHQPVLGCGKGIGGRAHRLSGVRQNFQRARRHVFELAGDVVAVGQLHQRVPVVPLAHNQPADIAGTGVFRRVDKRNPGAQRDTRQGQHAGQLAAAENARLHDVRGSLAASTASVWSCRQRRTLARISGRVRATMLAASKAALMAPALPVASVPTGTPPGIWAMESRESIPLSARDCMGTPSTGSTVLEATMPGRCAAPPAPATTTSMPRCSADPAHSNMTSGVRCAEMILTSCGTASASSTSTPWAMVSQSVFEPMMMPTSGELPMSVPLQGKQVILA